MIYEVTMYGAKCDNCGKQWVNDNYYWVALGDKDSLESTLGDDDWHTEESKEFSDKHYCPDCYSFDDDDKLVLKQI